jgi:hypothetical protein
MRADGYTMSGGGLLRPISTFGEKQRIAMRDANINKYVSGYVVVKHGHGIKNNVDTVTTSFIAMPGVTVVAFVRDLDGKKGWQFFQVPSSTMAILDE